MDIRGNFTVYDFINAKKICNMSGLSFKEKHSIIKTFVHYEYHGECLSNNYNYFLVFKCMYGHYFAKNVKDIANGHWCDECSNKIDLLNAISIGLSYECICLNDVYISQSTYMHWRCKNGHEFLKQRFRSSINTLTWCEKCRLVNRLAEAKAFALTKLGECLSDVYVNSTNNLLWKCFYGHQWEATMNSVCCDNTWCKKCYIYLGEEISRRLLINIFGVPFIKSNPDWLNNYELDGYNENIKIAFEYDGEQHYKFLKFFDNNIEDFKKRQDRDILKNKLCIENDVLLIRIPYFLKYTDIQNFIINICDEKNIPIKNREIIDITTFSDIYRCKDEKLEKFLNLIAEKNGVLLDENYISCHHKAKIKCENNHIFYLSANSIQKGFWCDKCATMKKKYSIEYMQKYAINKNGQCLSTIYDGMSSKLLWKCNDCNNEWSAPPKYIIYGHMWCSPCAQRIKKTKFTITNIQNYAIEKGGVCLSSHHNNPIQKLLWKCNKCTNQWKATVVSVMNRNTWCPFCEKSES